MPDGGTDIASLTALVYRHYPRGVHPDEPRFATTEESLRLACVFEAAAISCGKGYVAVPDESRTDIDPDVQRVIDALRSWKELGDRCRAAFPDDVVWDESGPFFDPGYKYTIAKPDYVHPSDDWYDPVCCMLSALAPTYAIYTYDGEPDPSPLIRYANFPQRYHRRIESLTQLVEELFGFTRLNEDTLRTVIPDVVPHASNCSMGEVTLMDALFTSVL